MRTSEQRFHPEDVDFFIDLAMTLAMIVLVWGLLSGCSFSNKQQYPAVSIDEVQAAAPK